MLAEESRPRKNLRVVDWARMVREHPYWLAGDGVHVSADGYRYRASRVARSVRRCHNVTHQFCDGSAGIVASSRYLPPLRSQRLGPQVALAKGSSTSASVTIQASSSSSPSS